LIINRSLKIKFKPEKRSQCRIGKIKKWSALKIGDPEKAAGFVSKARNRKIIDRVNFQK